MLTRSAVRDKLYSVDGTGIFQQRKYVDLIDRLRTDSVLTINFMEDGLYDFLSELDPTEFKDIIKEAVLMSLNTKFAGSIDVENAFRNLSIRLVSESVELMHNLNAREHENTVVVFDCEIIATEREKTYTKSCIGYCPLCGSEFELKADEDRQIGNTYCMNLKCKKPKLVMRKCSIKTDNIQTIYLQEPMSTAVNSAPVIFEGLLIGNLSGKVYIGQRKRITGIFKSVLNVEKNVNDIIIEVISEQDLEEKKNTEMSTELMKKFKDSMKNKEDFISKITNSYAPLITGYKDIKLSILLFLVGGHSKVKREDINLFLIGDPSMAKSELLKFGKRITDKSMYTTGRGASAAGLTIGLVKTDKGNYVAQAGVLPLCSGGFAFIDEFDKMNKDDRSSLHEGMEQRTVSIAKAGFRMTLPAKTPILAAANPKYGAYDPTQTVLDNVDIPLPLISRFDMIWLIRDKVDLQNDEDKARFILDTFTGEKDFTENVFSDDEMRTYLNYARTIEPTMGEDIKNKIVEIYVSMRKHSDPNGIPIGIRQLEALIRLTVAHAKLMFKEKVDLEDVERIQSLIDTMNKEFTNGKSFTQNTHTNKNMSNQHIADHIWSECRDVEGIVSYGNFIKKLSDSGNFTEKSAKEYFEKMERMCLIKHMGNNRWKKV